MDNNPKLPLVVPIPTRPWPLNAVRQITGYATGLVVRFMGESWKWKGKPSFQDTVEATAEYIAAAVNHYDEFPELIAQCCQLIELVQWFGIRYDIEHDDVWLDPETGILARLKSAKDVIARARKLPEEKPDA